MSNDDPFRTFRPRAVRVVIPLLLAAWIGGSTFLIVTMLRYQADYTTHITAIVILLVLAVTFLVRVLLVRAVPDRQGLRVYNIVLRHYLPWERIVSVRFGDRPWVQLDISDGTVLSVMAVQRADGTYARGEASRLAALVAAHEARDVDPGDSRG